MKRKNNFEDYYCYNLFRSMRSGVVLVLKVVCFVACAMLIQSCDEDEVNGLVRLKDHEYMPLQVGVYQIYEVSETEYVNGPVGVTQRYQLKTEVVDSLPGTGGFYTYVIHRMVRVEATENWQMKDTWSATFTDREAIVQQGNTSFVKLSLPLSLDVSWNGNLYNSLGEETYTISAFGQPMTLGVTDFADVVEVTQSLEEDAIVGNDIRKELYARGIGLIKRTEEVIVYCSNTPSCIGEQIIEQGRMSEQILIEYGRN